MKKMFLSSLAVLKMITFLTLCEKFNPDRDPPFYFDATKIPNFTLLNNQQIFIYLLSSEDNRVLNIVGKFIQVNMI